MIPAALALDGFANVNFMDGTHMFDGNPKVRACHWMLHKVFMVACHLNAILTRFIYILIIPCVCVRVSVAVMTAN